MKECQLERDTDQRQTSPSLRDTSRIIPEKGAHGNPLVTQNNPLGDSPHPPVTQNNPQGAKG
ncbi:MAG: hypothetical protein D3920_15660, partial [Candidatus Electrothrix sp. AW2]|nr:hypothetical protein [Candidatus Electrothrix gigas]